MIAFPKKPRAKRRKIIHVCARCNTAFKSRKACWAHLDSKCCGAVRETLPEAPDGHKWLTVFLGHSPEEMMEAWSNPSAPVKDATATALVRTTDRRVIETWRQAPAPHAFWIRNDAHIPAAQRAVDSAHLDAGCKGVGK